MSRAPKQQHNQRSQGKRGRGKWNKYEWLIPIKLSARLLTRRPMQTPDILNSVYLQATFIKLYVCPVLISLTFSDIEDRVREVCGLAPSRAVGSPCLV